MAFNRPTLPALIERIQQDVENRLPGTHACAGPCGGIEYATDAEATIRSSPV